VSRRRLIVIGMVALLGLYAGGSASGVTFADDGPTEVHLEDVWATAGTAQVEFGWITTSERDTAGFNVLRGTSQYGPWEQANDDLILAQDEDLTGAQYIFLDTGLAGGITYYYMLQEILLTGGSTDYTDYIRSATPYHGTYLPLVIAQ
jgi:hypothetical protein